MPPRQHARKTDSEPRKARRTQSERSETMRQRLIEATLHCLAHDGYAGTTISRVIEVAQVSRGAPVHHFPSKNAMIAAAAEQLVRQIYIALGRSIACLEASDDRLHDLIYASWKGVFQRTEYVALNELLQASRREPELAELLQKLWTASYHVLGNNADHYMEPCAEHVDVRQLMVLTQWLLRGMAEDFALVNDPGLFDHYLRLWTRMLAQQMRAKDGVTAPPPKPALWDSGLLEAAIPPPDNT